MCFGGRRCIQAEERYDTLIQTELIGIEMAAKISIRSGGHRRVLVCFDRLAVLVVL